MEVGLVKTVDIDEEMQQAYLDYAMSVIVARALPDARDGLKPVHRRILYAMYDMGLRPNTPFKKSARIVGEVLGKYHPHGDMAVYDAMARMAQDFSIRCLLVEGQGNFGSIDGDPPAAMRYTEARLAPPAVDILADINKNTVDFSDNFDGSLSEPDVLPAALPNMMVNGATGIAVGMSTSIPPHNLGEVVDALIYMLESWTKLDDVNVEDLMNFIKGPDFPTGGLIIQETGKEDLTVAYGSGRGKLTVQARAHFEEMSRGRNRIIITELPYMTNKSSLIERIAELAREERVEGIADLRDESDRHGLRIVIELNKTVDPAIVLEALYKNTPMRSTFSLIMLALVDGEPRMLSLKQALRVYLEHRLTVVRRRSEFDLEKARQRVHILEGLKIALANIEEIITLIRRSHTVETARASLQRRFKLTEVQAQAILDMPLRRLASLERKKIEDEYKDVASQIKLLESLLRSQLKMRATVADELRKVKEAYADRRRTQIISLNERGSAVSPAVAATSLVAENTIWVTATEDGLISRTLDEKPPRMSGNNAPRIAVRVNTRDTLYLVTQQGEAAGIPIYAIPETDNPQQGAPAHKISALTEDDILEAMFTLPPKEERAIDWFVFTTTRQGLVKRTEIDAFPGPTAKKFTVVKVNDGDQLGWLRLTNGKNDILLATGNGLAIRFSENDVRPMGLVAAGVNGIKLQKYDAVVGMEIMPARGEVLLVSSTGLGKRVKVEQFPIQGRYGQGVIAWKLPKNSKLIGITAGRGTTRLTLRLYKLAPKVMRIDDAPLLGRQAQGKTIQELKTSDEILELTTYWELPRPVLEVIVPKTSRTRTKPAPTSAAQKRPASSRAKPTGKRSKVNRSPSKTRTKKTN
jgi:DNA gyrase subunit A